MRIRSAGGAGPAARDRASPRRIRLLFDRHEIPAPESQHARAALSGNVHALTAREFGLLHALLLEHPGAVLSRTQLESRIYGYDDEVSSNAIEGVIHGLRKRFGNEIIRNVRGLG